MTIQIDDDSDDYGDYFFLIVSVAAAAADLSSNFANTISSTVRHAPLCSPHRGKKFLPYALHWIFGLSRSDFIRMGQFQNI